MDALFVLALSIGLISITVGMAYLDYLDSDKRKKNALQ